VRHVLAFDIRVRQRVSSSENDRFLQDATERISRLPGVEGVAVGSFVPWRDAGSMPRSSSPQTATHPPPARKIRIRGCV